MSDGSGSRRTAVKSADLIKVSPAEPARVAWTGHPCPKEGGEEVKCFRCGRRTREGLFIRLEKQGSPVKPETHPVCPDCAVDFWRWADEVRTSLTHERLVRKRGELEERERRLRQREAEVQKMRRKLEKKLDLRELEVVGRTR